MNNTGFPLTKALSSMLLRYMQYIYDCMVTSRLKAQMELLEDSRSAVFVDCGCGAATNTERLARGIGTQQVFGVDTSTALLKRAQEERGIAVIQANLNQSIPLQSNSVDVIAATDVLEHLVEPDSFVAELHRVLSPGGYVIVATPNLASWHNIFALLLGVQPFSGPNITSMVDADLELVHRMHRQVYDLPEEGDYDDQADREARRHIVVVAYTSLIRLIQRKGFVIEDVLGFGYYPCPPWLARLLSRVDKKHCHHLVIKARKPIG